MSTKSGFPAGYANKSDLDPDLKRKVKRVQQDAIDPLRETLAFDDPKLDMGDLYGLRCTKLNSK